MKFIISLTQRFSNEVKIHQGVVNEFIDRIQKILYLSIPDFM